jgi:KaiC/GvpD/RAD55 family RecA-like ATPase
MNRHLALMSDDQYDPDNPDTWSNEHPDTELPPVQLARHQAAGTRAFMEKVRAGGGLRFPWLDLDRMVGPLLPGWLVMVGGRAKAGKTTMLMELLTSWVEMRKTVVYVGTETSVDLLRYVWGAVRCNIPIDTAVDPKCPLDLFDRIMADVEGAQTQPALADFAIFADAKTATVTELGKWARYGHKYGADALVFDHFSRLEVGEGERWKGLGQAIRQIKQLAVEADMTLVVGAQLTQGEGGSILGEHEVPGNGSWAGSSEVQRECDVGVQLWRPFKPGVSAKQKQEAKEDMSKVAEIVQPGVMGVRLAAHRWGKQPNQFCKLYVSDGQISAYSGRTL